MSSMMNADAMKRHLTDMRTFGYPYNEEHKRILNEDQFGEKKEPEPSDERL